MSDTEHLVRYRGTALKPAIQPGDVLAFRKSETAEPDQVVLADVGGEARVVKYEPGMDVLGVLAGVYRTVA